MTKENLQLNSNMEIVKEHKNTLLKRKEVVFTLKSDANPGFENAKKAIGEKMKVADETIAVKYVKNNFGTHSFTVEAFVYDTKEDKEKIEPKPKAKKGATN